VSSALLNGQCASTAGFRTLKDKPQSREERLYNTFRVAFRIFVVGERRNFDLAWRVIKGSPDQRHDKPSLKGIWSRYVTDFWETLCKTVRPMLSVRCLSCLSVTLVYCGQTVGRIKMKLGMQVGLGPGHTVLGGDPAPPSLKGHNPPIFGPYLLRPTAWIKMPLGMEIGLDQGDFVIWGSRCSFPKRGGGGPPQIFGPCLL